MKQSIILFLVSLLAVTTNSFSQGTDGVLIDPNNATTRDASAVFQAQSTSQGILIPRMTAVQRGAIPVSAARDGLIVYQTDGTAGFYYYNGTVWVLIANTTGNLAGVTAGTGLTGGGTSGTITVNAVGDNGLTTNADDIDLGGPLTQAATTITQDGSETFTIANTGTGNTTVNLTSTGDFDVQDNGTSALFVRDDAFVGVGTNAPNSPFTVRTTVATANARTSSIANAANDALFELATTKGSTVNASGEITTQIGQAYNGGAITEGIRFIRGGGSTDGSMAFITNAGAERMRIASNGKVGIGTSAPTENLSVAGALTTANFQVKRDFVTWNTTASTNVPIHIKTNITFVCIMYRFLVEGYNYGMQRAIYSEAVGYADCNPSPTAVTSAQNNNHSNGVSISTYKSNDGYLVIKLDPGGSNYYLGFSVSAWLTNPAGNGFDVKATTIVQSSAADPWCTFTPGSASFAYSGSIVNWTVPACVTSITITAKGASGGYYPGYTPGYGASMTGTFAVTPGQVLSILVGQSPGSCSCFPGGGGGTFVALGGTYSSATPMIVAGGGGGAYSGYTGVGAPTTNNGTGSWPGTGGNGAPAVACGGGGGGFYSNGGNDTYYGYPGGKGFWQGGAGASVGGGYQNGGFGGGAVADYVGSCNTVAGAGGGYGGGSAYNNGSYNGSGQAGGSYNGGTSQSNTPNNNNGNGSVTITW